MLIQLSSYNRQQIPGCFKYKLRKITFFFINLQISYSLDIDIVSYLFNNIVSVTIFIRVYVTATQ